MFARTARLTLRPAWPEDAAALAAMMADRRVAGGVTALPRPLADAATWIAAPRGAHDPRFLIEAHDASRSMLVGGIGIADGRAGPELGCWLAPSARGRGYAVEAGRIVVEMARDALPFTRLVARHGADQAAAGRWLRRLGFRRIDGGAGLLVHDLDVDGRRPDMPIAA